MNDDIKILLDEIRNKIQPSYTVIEAILAKKSPSEKLLINAKESLDMVIASLNAFEEQKRKA